MEKKLAKAINKKKPFFMEPIKIFNFKVSGEGPKFSEIVYPSCTKKDEEFFAEAFFEFKSKIKFTIKSNIISTKLVE